MHLSLHNRNIYRDVYLPTPSLEKGNKQKKEINLHAYDKLSHCKTSVSTSQGSLFHLIQKHLWVQV